MSDHGYKVLTHDYRPPLRGGEPLWDGKRPRSARRSRASRRWLGMSDRIDELVAAIDANTLLQWDGKDVALEAAHELATIAREADKWRKVAEWLAGELYDEDYLGLYTRAARTSENAPYTPSDRVADIATIVATARAAIEQEEAE